MPFPRSAFSGFPFDDDFDNRRDRDGNFRSQLNNIAQRHPEFAEHLHSFRNRGSEPAAPSSGAHHQPFYQHTSGYADRPFASRFERYFPFEDRFDVEPEEYRQFYQSRPEYYPEYYHQQEQQPPQPSTTTSSAAEDQNRQEQSQAAAEQQQKQPEESINSIGSEKGRNLQQSNTVDLGKEQDPVNDRQQRSMSAPPPENRPRYRSHINIPINRDVGADNQPQQQQQTQPQQQQPQPQQQQSRPAERVIPIHVEGRDEPVIPRNVHQTFTSTPPPPQYQQHHPQPQQRQQRQPEQIFGQKPEMFTQFVPTSFGRQNDDIYRQQQQQYQREQEQKYRQQQEEAARQQQQQQQQQQTSQQQTETQKPSEAPPKPAPSPPSTPIDQIKAIQKDVSDLMTQVEQFAGTLRDKHYLYLEEMLTRQILKLDNIDAQGQENIRSARKESIRCIEATLSRLETKAKANAQQDDTKKIDAVEAAAKIENNEGQKEEKMETDPSAASSMEVVPKEQKITENRAVLVTSSENSEAATTTENQNENDKKEEGAVADADNKPADEENKETETNSDKKEKKKTKKKAAAEKK